jgi:hypothetical protein
MKLSTYLPGFLWNCKKHTAFIKEETKISIVILGVILKKATVITENAWKLLKK